MPKGRAGLGIIRASREEVPPARQILWRRAADVRTAERHLEHPAADLRGGSVELHPKDDEGRLVASHLHDTTHFLFARTLQGGTDSTEVSDWNAIPARRRNIALS